jgi:hypothetical protein
MLGFQPGQRDPVGPPADWMGEEEAMMLAFILFLVIVWIVLGVIGLIIKGLIWLTIIAALLFVVSVFFGGRRTSLRNRR